MNITVLPSGDLEMKASDSTEQFEFAVIIASSTFVASPVGTTQMSFPGWRNPRGDGVNYALIDFDEDLYDDSELVLSDGNHMYHFDSDDLLPRLAAGETVTWKRI